MVAVTASFQIAYHVVFDVVRCLAIIGNVIVIMAILMQRSLQSNYYFLVLHLALCDFLLPLTSFLKDNQAIPYHGRIASTIVFNTTLFAEYFIVVAIAALRLRGVANPFSLGLPQTKVFLLVAFLYPLSLMIGVLETVNVTFKVGSLSFTLYFHN